jgi:hypothetical protein
MELQSRLKSIRSIIQSLQSLSNIHENKLRQIKHKWKQFRNKNKNLLMKPWAKQIIKLDAKKAKSLFEFRDELNKYIIVRCNTCDKDICTKCGAFGSTKLTSDIDVTINSELQVLASLKTMIILLNDLYYIFKDDSLFYNGKYFQLKKVHKFFDINFYISDFSIAKTSINNKNIKNFDTYFISTCYHNNCKNVTNQYYFAFLEFLLFEYGKKKISKKYILNHTKIMRELLKVTENLHNSLQSKLSDDIIINLISILSLYGDEGYHSQGAFFHVVMMLQKKIQFKVKSKKHKIFLKNLISASIIENLCFAYTHYDKKEKYLSRVRDGLYKLKEYNIDNYIFNQLKYNIDHLNDEKSIKKSILILFKLLQIKRTIKRLTKLKKPWE